MHLIKSGVALALFTATILAPSMARETSPNAAKTGRSCRKVELWGEVATGQSWKASLGQGKLIRLIPIEPSGQGFSGWDLVVNSEKDAAFPDALLLATPPYGSLSQREIGTTYGLRAQDAIAWSPRKFHFLIADKDVTYARPLFAMVMKQGVESAALQKATSELLQIVSDPDKSAAGEFAVTDARLNEGTADPPKFARQWASHLSLIPHTVLSESEGSTPLGKLIGLHFRITLLLPYSWKLQKELLSESVTCLE